MSMPDLPASLLLPVPALTGSLPGIGGIFKEQLDDFIVEEIPSYEPCGTGEHLYLWIEKRDMGAEYFQRQLAQRLNIPTGEIGTAGMKDRRAVTRQWVSVPVRCEAQLPQLEGNGIVVLKVSKHGNKLRPGHLRGNRFEIRLRQVKDTSSLQPILETIQSQGLPNYYGSQRFGRENETLHMGWRLLHGDRFRISPFLKKLALSAVQSAIFNRSLSERMEEGLFRKALLGDVMGKWPAGGLFVSQDVATEQQRFDAREIVHTGPMFGSKMKAAEADVAQREARLLAEVGLKLEQFDSGGRMLEGTRRHNVIYVEELQWTAHEETVTLKFSLPSGCYATVLLSEVIKSPLPTDGD